jgi:hypothetical protein
LSRAKNWRSADENARRNVVRIITIPSTAHGRSNASWWQNEVAESLVTRKGFASFLSRGKTL